MLRQPRYLAASILVTLAALTCWWWLGLRGASDRDDTRITVDAGEENGDVTPTKTATDLELENSAEAEGGERDVRQDGARDNILVLRVLHAKDRTPIRGAEIRKWNFGFGSKAEERERTIVATTDREGLARVPWSIRSRHLIVEAKGFASTYMRADAQPSEERELLLQDEARIDVILKTKNGSPPPRARVTLYLFNRRRQTMSKTTDASGRAFFDRLPPGYIKIEVHDDSRRQAQRPGASSFLARTRLRRSIFQANAKIAAGETRRVVAELEDRVDLELLVRENGKLITDGRIGLVAREIDSPEEVRVFRRAMNRRASALTYAATTSIRKDGIARFADLRVGVRDFVVRLGHYRFAHRVRIDMSKLARREVMRHTIKLQPARLTIEVEGDADLLERANIFIRDKITDGATRVAVHGKARLELEGLGAGDYSLELRGRGIIEMPGEAITIRAGGTHSARLRVPTPVPITVRVPNAKRIAVVRWHLSGSTDIKRTRLIGGRGVLQLAPGTWILEGRAQRGEDNYGPARTVEVRAGFPRTVDLTAK